MLGILTRLSLGAERLAHLAAPANFGDLFGQATIDTEFNMALLRCLPIANAGIKRQLEHMRDHHQLDYSRNMAAKILRLLASNKIIRTRSDLSRDRAARRLLR